jgi:hypothetical protein
VYAGGSATTDAQGNYFIKRVPTGSRTITGEATGYLKSSLSVTLVQGDRNTFNIVLKKHADITPPVTKYRLVPITDTVNGKKYIKGFYIQTPGHGRSQRFGREDNAISNQWGRMEDL